MYDLPRTTSSGGTALFGVRVPRAEADLLEAAAFVRRLSLQKLLEPVLTTYAASLRDDLSVQEALAARAKEDAAAAQEVTPIRRARST
jgi:hypothetical protein